MEPGNNSGPYWALYCAVFIICVVGGSLYQWLYLDAWSRDTWMSTLSDVFSVALGSALSLAILVEGGVSMVLFAPKIMRRFREQGRQQGLEEGRQEGIVEGRQEGLQEANAAWEAWNNRRLEAESNNLPFNEPPPSQDFPNGKV